MQLFKKATATTTPIPAKTPPFVFPDSLSEFSKEDLALIYSTFPIKKLRQGEVIAKPGERRNQIFLVVEGSLILSLSLDGLETRIPFFKDEFLQFSSSLGKQIETLTLIAAENTRVLEMSQVSFRSLPEKIQLAIQNNLQSQFVKIIDHLSTQNLLFARKNHQFRSYLAALDANASAITASALIQNTIKKIPKLPTYAYDLIGKLHDENIKTEEVVNSIQNDPSLASIVLKRVNSAYYGLQEKVTDVYRAVLLLGFRNIYELILTEAVSSVMPKEEEFSDIQKHSLLISAISYEIAMVSKQVRPPTITTIGLLHEVGKIVTSLLKRKHANIHELLSGLDDAKMGASLLESWNLPEGIFKVIEEHRKPEFTPPEAVNQEYKFEIGTIYLAHICHDILMGADISSAIYLPEYMAALELPETNPQEFCKRVIIPALLKNPKRLPAVIRNMLTARLLPAHSSSADTKETW